MSFRQVQRVLQQQLGEVSVGVHVLDPTVEGLGQDVVGGPNALGCRLEQGLLAHRVGGGLGVLGYGC